MYLLEKRFGVRILTAKSKPTLEHRIRKITTMKRLFSLVLLATAFGLAARAQRPGEECSVRGGYNSLSHSDLQSRSRQLTFKTNVPALGLLIGNVAVEVELTKALSLNVPVYYSALDYFNTGLKFRTLALQPELRWYIPESRKFFTGAHFGLAWYNFAIGGNYRYQDRDGNTPAVGGGLSVGYRQPLCRSGRWKLEFAVGGGVYRLRYDLFYNEPNGALAGREAKTYIGLDNAAVSVTYSVGMGRARR